MLTSYDATSKPLPGLDGGEQLPVLLHGRDGVGGDHAGRRHGRQPDARLRGVSAAVQPRQWCARPREGALSRLDGWPVRPAVSSQKTLVCQRRADQRGLRARPDVLRGNPSSLFPHLGVNTGVNTAGVSLCLDEEGMDRLDAPG